MHLPHPLTFSLLCSKMWDKICSKQDTCRHSEEAEEKEYSIGLWGLKEY